MREFHFSGLDGGKWVSGRRIMARRHGTMAAVGGAAVARDRGGGGGDALGAVHLGCVAAIKTRDTPSRSFDPGRWLRIVRSVLNRAYVRFEL
jgi:hypothetical protein